MPTNRPEWVDLLSPRGTREATAKILTGRNYRLFYDRATRRTLIEIYRELAKLSRKYPTDNAEWQAHVRDLVRTGNLEDQRMRQWLIGLTKKTATNLGVKTIDYPTVFDEMMSDIETAVSGDADRREMTLLIWCGAATLTIRGSHKAKIGKKLERSIARAILTIIGLNEEEEEFRLNVGADREVDRETDAEVRTPRGFVRVEVGLIGEGNSEVIGDKVGRLQRNSVILMDKIPVNSAAYLTAEHRGVRLIQLRNNHAVEEVREHLAMLGVPVQKDKISLEDVEERVLAMPVTAFGELLGDAIV